DPRSRHAGRPARRRALPRRAARAAAPRARLPPPAGGGAVRLGAAVLERATVRRSRPRGARREDRAADPRRLARAGGAHGLAAGAAARPGPAALADDLRRR